MSNTLFTNFSAELKNQIGIWYEIIRRKLTISHTFKKNHVFIEEEGNQSEIEEDYIYIKIKIIL